MKTNELILIHSDKYETPLIPYLSSAAEIRGTVVVLHNLAEHCGRYREFSLFLNQHGYDVYLYNQRGHGQDKMLEELGILSERDGYKKLILDAVDVLSYVSEHNRGSRLYLFGQGSGSLIARGATQVCDLADAVILSGTVFPTLAGSLTASLLSALVCQFRGKNHISPFLNRFLTEGKLFRKLSERTRFDWMTRNQEAVGAYISDPYCGFVCTAGYYRNLFRLAHFVSQPINLRQTRKDLPILLISGDQDAVSHYGNDVIRLMVMYQKLHFTKIDCTLYEGCRHELLNEPNRQEIMSDIIGFLESSEVSDPKTDKNTF
ncbi:MAG: alpha/beta hydrolase [Lachnospiraceae bacterium]|nr:alpha/beta hydrolase [Lachnospiraceae bacterium]